MSSNNASPVAKFSGWTVVTGAFFLIFFHMIVRGSFATLIPAMVADTGWSTGTVSAGSSFFLLFYGLFAFLTGTYIGKLGCRLTYTIHALLLGGGLFLCSYATQPWQYWVFYGVMGGAGAGAFWAPVTAMVRQWFIEKLGLAMGLAIAAAGLSMGLAPIISMYLIAGQSWQMMMRILGVVLIVGIAVAAQFTTMKPEDAGQKPLGFEAFMARMAASAGTAPKQEFYVPFAWAVKNKVFWIFAFAWFFSNFAEFIVFAHAINYVTLDLGFSKIDATYAYCLIGFVFIFSAIYAGNIADSLTKKLGDPIKARKRILTFAYLGAACSCIWLNYVVRGYSDGGAFVVPFAVYTAFFGFVFGTYITTFAGLVGVIMGRKEMAPAWGFITVVGMGGGAGLGPYVAGALRDSTGSYFPAIWLSTVCYVVAVILVNIQRQPTNEEIWGPAGPPQA